MSRKTLSLCVLQGSYFGDRDRRRSFDEMPEPKMSESLVRNVQRCVRRE